MMVLLFRGLLAPFTPARGARAETGKASGERDRVQAEASGTDE